MDKLTSENVFDFDTYDRSSTDDLLIKRHLDAKIFDYQEKVYESLIPAGETPVKVTTFERLLRDMNENIKQIANRGESLQDVKTQLANQLLLNKGLETQVSILRDLQISNVAHKRLAKYSLAFFLFFALSYLSKIFLGVVIVEPLWNDIGLLFSFGFLTIALLMGLDWKNNINKG